MSARAVHVLYGEGSKLMRIAIVHDWLTTYAGAERVLEQVLSLYPSADLFSVCDFLPDEERQFLKGIQPRTTFIQRLPRARRHYRSYLSLMPLAIEQLDVSSYDVVISSSHAVSKGIITGPCQLHISYVHSPIRYAWDLQHQYLREAHLTRGFKSWLARWQLHKIRMWDQRTANGVDKFVANSKFIARRIRKVYGRESTVIYPPVAVGQVGLQEKKQDFFFTASRMVPYKRVDLIVEAFGQMPHMRLVVVGDGPDMRKVKSKAGPNVEVLGYQDSQTLRELMSNAKGFVFAAEEDFGIAPVEAQACGTPVIAYGKGGALETVVEGKTGIFFNEQTPEAIVDAVQRFESQSGKFTAAAIRRHAEQYSVERFRSEFAAFVDAAWVDFLGEPGSASSTVQAG